MHQNKLVLAVKANGKVLREHGENVYLPFGCEYTVYIKNLNSVRCLVNLEIDGSDIAEGTQFIVPANGFIELERFVKNGNMSAGNRFKFIERTARVEAGRGGIQAEDGLIRIQYEFERLPVPISNRWSSQTWSSQTVYTKGGFNPSGSSSVLRSRGIGSASAYDPSSMANDFYFAQGAASAAAAPETNVAGVTVAGSISSQSFVEVGYIPTDGVKHAMVLKLLGEVGQVEVTQPVTVKTKQKCTTCGHVNKSSAKFCSACGTSLTIV